MIKVNLDKAKEIHKNNLRAARSEEFKSLDVDFMKAVEQSNNEKMTEISSKKQELRDITTAEEIVSASSVDELKSHWPDVLSMSNPYEVQQ
jgi:hypothetical protein